MSDEFVASADTDELLDKLKRNKSDIDDALCSAKKDNGMTSSKLLSIISICFDISDIEMELKMRGVKTKRTNCSEIIKNARKLWEKIE